MSRQDAYNRYKDENGEPRFAESTVLYFDLLGIASMARDRAALEYLGRLRPALEEAADLAETDDPEESHASTWFTDNLVVATPILGPLQDEEGALLFTFLRASYLCLPLLKAGFVGRGGIGFGDHYMDDRFVFGSALIDAVEAEKCTKYPRIALTPAASVLACGLVASSGSARPKQVPHIQCLACDSEGVVFVDWITTWLDEEDDVILAHRLLEVFRNQIVASLAASADRPEVHEKWQWMADYFNWALSAPDSSLSWAKLRIAARAAPVHAALRSDGSVSGIAGRLKREAIAA